MVVGRFVESIDSAARKRRRCSGARMTATRLDQSPEICEVIETSECCRSRVRKRLKKAATLRRSDRLIQDICRENIGLLGDFESQPAKIIQSRPDHDGAGLVTSAGTLVSKGRVITEYRDREFDTQPKLRRAIAFRLLTHPFIVICRENVGN